MIRVTALLAVLGAPLVVTAPVHAAAPNYILVSGPGLARPVLLANWRENLDLLLTVANAPRVDRTAARGLAGRRRIDLAEFWGWSGQKRPTQASKTDQNGSFFPAHGRQPAVIVLMVRGATFPRLVPAKALGIFARHGVPTRL